MYEPFVKRRDFLFSMSTLGAWTLMGGPAHALERLSASPAPRSPWLSGNFAPVMDELNVDNLLVEGAIPKNLNGTFLRNGPNPIYPANPYHWFDGDGMIHGVSIKDGKASYANRFVLTEGFEREKAAGKSLYGGFLAGPPFKNAANISIVHHHGKTLAAWEGGSPYEINSSTLATVGSYDFEKQWATAFTAHPKIDPVTDQMVFFGYDFKPPYLHYGVLSPTGKLIHSTTIDIPNPVMIHDFAITENYSIFLDLPLVFSERGLKFTPSAGARMGVLPRLGKNSDVKWFNIETCWVYHVLNAFEEDDEIVLRASKHPDWPTNSAVLHEWRLSLKSGTVKESTLDTASMEFPIVNPRVVGRKHRYGYAALNGRSLAMGFAKYDLVNRTKEVYDFGLNKSGGETFFVPDSSATAEDAGYLLNIVYDEAKNESALIIVDAKTLGLLASVRLPRRVPFGLHANWINLSG